ncbi:hypothetical protein ACFX16_024380 [Malus domestica]
MQTQSHYGLIFHLLSPLQIQILCLCGQNGQKDPLWNPQRGQGILILGERFQKLEGGFQKLEEVFQKLEEGFQKLEEGFQKLEEGFQKLVIQKQQTENLPPN